MTLLDIAGYSLFNNADAFLATTGKVFLTGAGVLVGGFFLLIFLVLSLVAIGIISVRRGIRYQSVPRAVGTFFRWSGVAVALFFSALIIPVVAYWFSVPSIYLLLALGIALAMGYFIGRTISKLIGGRIGRFASRLRTADSIGSRIIRFVNSI